MKNLLNLLILAVLMQGSLWAQNTIPTGYYNGTETLSGEPLKTALNNIIQNNANFPYTSTNTDTWDILKTADADPSHPENVIMLYSGRSVNAAQEYNNGLGWTREHVWPQSRGDFNTNLGIGTDLHNLKPENVSVNSARGNRWFDYADFEYVDNGFATGSKTSSTRQVWEPRDAVKGDVARIIFYIATRYEGENSELDMEISDIFPSDDSDAPTMALLSTLKKWNIFDPVDDFERNRNNVIYSYQGNRNPFIDHPEYVARIWGPTNTDCLFMSEYVEGSSYNKAIEIYNNSSNIVNLSGYRIERDNGGNNIYSYFFSLSGSIAPHGVYVVAHSSAVSQIIQKANVTTSSTAMSFNGDDQIRLVYNGVPVDRIGIAANYGENRTFVRSGYIAAGSNDIFDPRQSSEWIQLNSDCFNFLGYHEISETLDVPRVFISEYIEGSGYNKGIEIYNGSSQTIDLSQMALLKQTNGTGGYAGFTFSGNLTPYMVYCIVNPQAVSTLLAKANLTKDDGVMDFNGDDPIQLVYKGVVVDQIGISGGLNYGKDKGLYRNQRQIYPSNVYYTSEWYTSVEDDFTHFGAHDDFYKTNPITFYAISNGNWKTPSIWSNQEGGTAINMIPDKKTHVVLKGFQVEVTENVETGNILLNDSSQATKLNISQGNMTIYGQVNISRTSTGTVEMNVAQGANVICIEPIN